MKYVAATVLLGFGALSGALAAGAVASKAGDPNLPIPVPCTVADLPCTHSFPGEIGRPGPVVMPGTDGGNVTWTSRKANSTGVILTLYEKNGHRIQSLFLKGKFKLVTCARPQGVNPHC